MSIKLFNKLITCEFRSGTGIDIEFCDSRPVWVFNEEKQDVTAMPFEGIVIMLPCMVITWGNVYTEEYLGEEK